MDKSATKIIIIDDELRSKRTIDCLSSTTF